MSIIKFLESVMENLPILIPLALHSGIFQLYMMYLENSRIIN
jgi:hypothetical protein